MGHGPITVELTRDEALVLSDWLERVQMTHLSRLVEDGAVWAPIHRLAGTPDTALPEIFAADYAERLAAARLRLLPSDDTNADADANTGSADAGEQDARVRP
ncbi:hypothetical protein [Streptomyces sp. NBC_01207]|uniref:hypothetical protein n=1 Tax=Streptomyces sp. NBC_01207 TaxID=2903772 RepID=UPI002E157FD1|nr:hypothetical protein OG457_03410 [Streptomyces sp. NBC_01207]